VDTSSAWPGAIDDSLRALVGRLREAPTPADADELGELLRRENARGGSRRKEIIDYVEPVVCGLSRDFACSGRVSALLGLAVHHVLAGANERALRATSIAVDVAGRLGDGAWIGKAQKVHGTTLMETGNIPEAIEAFAEALKQSRAIGDLQQECAVWVNLGVAHQYSQHYGDAIACFERAVELAGNDPSMQHLKELGWTNIAHASLQIRDVARGMNAARMALLQPEPKSSMERTNRVFAQQYYCRLLLEVGLVEQALTQASLAREMAALAGTDRAMIVAELAVGLAEVHAGQQESGLRRLTSMMERARRGQIGMLADCLLAAIKGYEAAGQSNVALVYMRELARMNKDRRSSQVLLHHRRHLSNIDEAHDQSALAAMQDQESALKERLHDRQVIKAMVEMLEKESVAAELHDDTTGEHCYRVGRLASLLGQEYGVDEHTCFLIDLAARMHDIGKLSVPDRILQKPGKFTPEERALMETHTTAGANLLAQSSIPQMYVAEEIARGHHEKWDGTGYPQRLRGAEIPLAARITALADVFDALTHVRPYKSAWSIEASLAEIRSLRGRHFDPEITDLFLDLVPRLRQQHGDLDAFLAEDAKNSPYIAARAQTAAALKESVNRMSTDELLERR
jgi:putative two-component system response regulator